jgi:PAS domain S-box-containing protein
MKKQPLKNDPTGTTSPSCPIDRLGSCLLHAPDAIFIADESGRYIEVNGAASRMLGYSREELLSMKVGDLAPESERDNERVKFSQLKEKKTFKSETSLLTKKGKVIPIAIDAVMLPDGTFAAFCKDISPLKTTQKELAESEQFTRILLNTIPLPVFYKDTGLRYIGVNRAFSEFLGNSSEYFKGKTVYDIAPENIAGEYNIKDLDALASEKTLNYQAKVVTRENGVRDAVFYKTMFRDAEGNPGGIIGVMIDVTEQLKTVKNRDLYFNAIQSLDQPMLITEKDGRIIAINRAFSSMYGFDESETIGKKPSILNPGKSTYIGLGYTEDAYNRLFSSMWAALKDPARGAWNDIVINRKKDGSLIWVRLMINTIYDKEGKPEYHIGLPLDVTKTVKEERKSKVQLYRTIASLAELRDNETGNHMRRVGVFAKIIARAKGMPDKYCDDIEIFAPMHDIGKVGILDSILLSENKLSDEEFAVMKTHTTLGYNIVKSIPELEMVAAITLSHHEKFDGSGYPSGLSGERIPLSARITAIVDVYDALRSRRPYKNPVPHAETLDIMRRGRGSHFDPDLFDLFIAAESRFDAVYRELKD